MRFTLAGLLVAALCVFAAPAAQASDASLKRAVKNGAEKFENAVERYDKAVDEVETESDLDNLASATKRLSRATSTYHKTVKAEQADSSKLKTARTKFLDALSTYKRGLDKLVKGIEAKSESQINSAKRTIQSSGKKFEEAAKAFS